MRVLFLLAALFAGSLSGLEVVWKGEIAPGIAVVVSRSADTVGVDHLLQVEVDVTYPEGYKVNKALLRSNLLDYPGYGITPFTLVSEETIVVKPRNEKITYLLDPDIPGKYALTFRDIVFDRGEEKGAVRLLSGVFDVEVTMPKEMAVGTGEPFGVLPLSVDLPIVANSSVREAFLDNPSWLAWVRLMGWREFRHSLFPWRGVVAAVVLAMIGGVFFLFVWIRGRRQERKEPHRVTARSRALKDIDDIRARGLPQRGEYDQYYVLLTGVVRKYLEEAYLIRAETLTTEEFLVEAVRHPDLDESTRLLLENFLDRADKVKFARHQPTGLECADAERAAGAVCSS